MVGGIGMVVDNAAIPSSLWSATLRHGYVGCMRDLVVNGNAVDLAAFARQQDSGKRRKWGRRKMGEILLSCSTPYLESWYRIDHVYDLSLSDSYSGNQWLVSC